MAFESIKKFASKFVNNQDDSVFDDDVVENREEDMEFIQDHHPQVNKRNMNRRDAVHSLENHKQGHDQDTSRVLLMIPLNIKEGRDVIQYVRMGSSVICNFESVAKDVAQRVFDYISGGAFALGGIVEQVASKIFVIVPPNVLIENKLKEIKQNQNQNQNKQDPNILQVRGSNPF